MRLVVFYEKPFCAANAKQKQLLRSSGCSLIERNLLEHGLDAQTLRSFMGDKAVEEWFNPAAPQIKKGLISPERLDESEALALLMRDPILIRRPLMMIGSEKLCGFDTKRVAELLEREIEPMVQVNCMEKGCLQKGAL